MRRTFSKPAQAAIRIFLKLLVTGDHHGLTSKTGLEFTLRDWVCDDRSFPLRALGVRIAGPRWRSPGSAGHFTQLVMAITVYGAPALVVGARLIGAARRR